VSEITDVISVPHKLFRKAVQQGRSERRGESYSLPYGEPLSEASTPLADFVNSLLAEHVGEGRCLRMPTRRQCGFLLPPEEISLHSHSYNRPIPHLSVSRRSVHGKTAEF